MKWKAFSLIMIGLFVAVVALGYSEYFSYKGKRELYKGERVQLTEEEKQMIVDIAKNALRDKITEEFTPVASDFGWRVKLNSETKTMSRVYFHSSSQNITYRIMIDMDRKEAVQIIETRSWMAEKSKKYWTKSLE